MGLFFRLLLGDQVNGPFVDLSDKNFFVGFVTDYLQAAPQEIASVMRCTPKVDSGRVELAYGAYHQNIEKFAVLLRSSNPDHYKRAGALLHALYQSEPVVSVGLESSSEDLESGFTRVTLGDAQHILSFVEFYEEFHNQMLSFDIAYRFCASYEPDPRGYNFDYLHNVCRYLKSNKNLSVDSFFIMFKSLMM